VIFGFNTDIKYGDTVYHVQSEVREHDSLLQTQVFVKGRCLGKYETSFEEQAGQPDFSEDRLHDLLKAQHKHFVECARAGTIEEEVESGRGLGQTPASIEPAPPASATGAFAFPPSASPPSSALASATGTFASPLSVSFSPESLAVPSEFSEADEPGEKDEERIPISLGDDADLAAIAEASAASATEPESGVPPEIPIRLDEVSEQPLDRPLDPVLDSFLAELAEAEKLPPPPPLPQYRVDVAGSVMGKGIGLDCLEPITAPDGNDLLLNVQVLDNGNPSNGAQVTCRISMPNGPAAYVYSTTNADGIADLRIATHALEADTGLLIQAAIHGRSGSRKFHLRRV
jgi:hypothetical protein